MNFQIHIGIIAIRVYAYTWRMYGEGGFRGVQTYEFLKNRLF